MIYLNNLNNHKFLVIGSNSFSGSHFVNRAITEGYKVWGVSRSEEPHDIFLPYKWEKSTSDNKIKTKLFSFNKIDLNNDLDKLIELIDEVKPSHILNFASQGMVAESWLKPLNWYKTNVLAQVALHDELRKKDFIEKYVHISTPEVYGNTEQKWIKESYIFSPSTPYAVSRASCDLHLLSFYKAYNFPVIFTRAANVYGPGQQLYRIIPRTILSTRTKKPMNLHGGGVSERSFIHIDDVIDATLKLALHGEPGTNWHISTKDSIKIIDLVKLICKYSNVKFESIVNISSERLGKDQSYLLDSSAIRKEFNWEEKVDLKQGIQATFEWIDLNISKLRNMSWDYTHKA